MSKLNKMLKAKSAAQNIAYATLLVGLVADIIFIALDFGDFTFTIGCFVCILLGSLVGLADIFLDGGTCIWLASLLYSAAVGFHLYKGLQSVSDLWNGVNFIGGNQTMAIVFGIIFLVLAFTLIALNFFELKKKRAE